MRRMVIAGLVLVMVSTGVAGAQTAEPTAPAIPTAAQPEGEADIVLIDGPDAIARSAQLAALTFPEGAPTVHLARADVVADALAAGPVKGPVLLVPSCGPLPAETARAIDVLAPTTITALGGTAAVCDDLLAQAGAGRTTSRLAGASRIDTAVAVATATHPEGVATAYVASAADSPDAVAVGTAADGPVLLVPPTGPLPEVVRAAVATLGVRQLVLVGGEAALDAAVQAQLQALLDTVRLAGTDRFDTAGIVGGATFGPGSRQGRTATTAYLVDGASLADAVASASALDGPVLLTGGCDQPLPAGTADQLSRLQPTRLVVLDPTLVCPRLVEEARDAVARGSVPPADDHAAAVTLPQVVLPGIGAPCPAPPPSPLVPAGAVCVQVLAVDLDGQGSAPATLDRVVTWTDPASGSSTVVTTTSTDRVAQRVDLPGATPLPAGAPATASTALPCVLDLTGDGISEVLATVDAPPDGPATDVVLTTRGGAPTLVTTTTGEPVRLTSQVGEGTPGSGWRPVPGGGGVVTVQHDPAAQPRASWTRMAAVGSQLVVAGGRIGVPGVAPGSERYFEGTGCRGPQLDDRVDLGPATVGPVSMGSGYTPARAALDIALGAPAVAGDWAAGVCAPQERTLAYPQGLRLVFDRQGPGGDGALNYAVADHPLVIATDGGVTTGTTVAELQARHPGLRLTIAGGSPRAVLDQGAAYPRLAQLTGIGSRDVVTLLYQTTAAGC